MPDATDRPIPPPATRPEPGDRVRHIRTGDIGTLDHHARQAEWAMVRWDTAGPGMVRADGLSFVAPTLLVRTTG